MSKKSILFIFVCALTLLFALITDQRWEDWYITYRASKNLASGNGLVYTIGQRVYSFTSPLGTLIPSLIAYLTRNKSDDLVIWVYRAINAIVLGFTSLTLLKLAGKMNLGKLGTILMIGLFCTNILIIDFSINGMETAFMMFFLVNIISVLVVPERPSYLKLVKIFDATENVRNLHLLFGEGFLMSDACFEIYKKIR